jgi:hypothetical protein
MNVGTPASGPVAPSQRDRARAKVSVTIAPSEPRASARAIAASTTSRRETSRVRSFSAVSTASQVFMTREATATLLPQPLPILRAGALGPRSADGR